MKNTKVGDYIRDTVRKEKMHMTLLDPDKQVELNNTEKIVDAAVEAGTDAFMVGGSTGIDRNIVSRTVKEIKEETDVPVILFPTDAGSVAENADAIYFMTIMNSTNVSMVMGEQAKGAPFIKKVGLEPISMGYIIVEPGMRVAMVSETDVVPRVNSEMAVGYALAAQYFGFSLVYLEAGSGAPEPVPGDMISRVKEEIDIPLIVGGGIRTADQARKVAESGADVMVTGTIVEEVSDVKNRLGEIINQIKD